MTSDAKKATPPTASGDDNAVESDGSGHPSGPDVAEGTVSRKGNRENARESSNTPRRAIEVKTLFVAVLFVVLVGGLAITCWLLHSKIDELDSMNQRTADAAHAEQVALDYSVGAAEMNFQDLPSWLARLTAGTNPELTNKLTNAATSMEQIITPLQWVSSSTPVAAKVRSTNDGIYVVDCFVSVMTKNTQAPDGIQSTATYSLTVDSGDDWTITDVGGIGSALSGK